MDLTIIPNRLLAKISDEIFSKNDLILYIINLTNCLKLDDYCRGIGYNNTIGKTFTTYNFYTKKMTIYYEAMIMKGKLLSEENNFPVVLITNLIMILSIIHEIVHMYQNACLHEKSFPIYQIHKRELYYTNNCDDETYDDYYNCLIFEREAETIALENILVIIRRFVPNAEIFSYFIELLKETIINGYEYRGKEFYSPIKVIYQDLFKEEPPEIIIPDFYDSLKIGNNVSVRQYNLFKKNYQKIIIDRNNLQIKV